MDERLKKYINYIKNFVENEKIRDSHAFKIRKNFLENVVFKISKKTYDIILLEIYNENKILKYFKRTKPTVIYFISNYLKMNNDKYYLCYYNNKNQFLCVEKPNITDLPAQKHVKLEVLIEKLPEIYENAKNYFNGNSLIEMDKAENNLLNILYSSTK